jgi:hypothetical protein
MPTFEGLISTKIFGLDDTFGLSSVLQSGWTSIKNIRQIGHTSCSSAISENLDVLPSGPPIDDVCTVLFTERFARPLGHSEAGV